MNRTPRIDRTNNPNTDAPQGPVLAHQHAAGHTRRDVLLGLGGAAMALTAGAAIGSDGHQGNDGHQHHTTPGFDAETGAYTLAPLPYDPAALEPHIDAQTMSIHHGRHHAGYVRGLNNALAKLQEIRTGGGDPSTVEHWSRELSFNAGGHINHALFWTGMAPAGNGGGGEPDGPLRAAIDRDFGAFEQFTAHFKAASASVEGSGWGWLVYEPLGGRLMVTQMHSQQMGLFASCVPLLGVDVWEHAYYLRYQNKRSDYITAFMNVINWPEIARRFAAATA
ncbi:MAG: superoxide dismutase [Planctomycetota bacterium]